METTLNLFRSKTTGSILLLSGLLVILLLISLATGAVAITPVEILQVFGHRIGLIEGINETQELVLLNIRLPRLLLTILIGAALGLSGATLQGLFRNPLVEPGIIGVSSGAALGVIVIIMFLGAFAPQFTETFGLWLTPLFAFTGGLIATFITLKLSQYEGKTQITYLILAGVAITSLTGAVIGLSIFYADDVQLRTYTFWTLGDLSVASWDSLNILFPIIALACVGLIALARPLNAIALGEAEAFHSGVAVEKVKLWAVLLSALAVGTSVAFTGIIGFVGLVVPHIIRISFSSDHTLVLPASALGGACLLVSADLFARTIVAPAELPIGVITAVIGTPFFIYLLITSKKKRLI
ncbi:MAG: FecCD family ABC transporter permease [Candidatus Cyclobacteriaceae bacterium M2_1C_046]